MHKTTEPCYGLYIQSMYMFGGTKKICYLVPDLRLRATKKQKVEDLSIAMCLTISVLFRLHTHQEFVI